jgi:DNA polymerase III delta prime subunit
MENNESLVSKYRPRNLSEILGQGEVVRALRLFVAEPYPTSFFFHGPSGVGKTSAAYALAHELGVAVDEGELGGLYEIASGEQRADAVREMLNSIRLRPLFGSGWKVLIVNEADRMRIEAETIWLDGLEHLPPKTVVVFTTNCPEKLSQRFRDRCEVLAFESQTTKLRPAIRQLARRIWQAEVGQGECPMIDMLGLPTLTGVDSLHASFRLALQQLQRAVREVKIGGVQSYAH